MFKHDLFTHTVINKSFHISNILKNTKYDLPPKLFSQYLFLHLHLTQELLDYHLKKYFFIISISFDLLCSLDKKLIDINRFINFNG